MDPNMNPMNETNNIPSSSNPAIVDNNDTKKFNFKNMINSKYTIPIVASLTLIVLCCILYVKRKKVTKSLEKIEKIFRKKKDYSDGFNSRRFTNNSFNYFMNS